MQPRYFWHLPFRVITESYSIMALSAIMTVMHPHFARPGPIIDTICAILGFITVTSFPVIALWLMLKNFNDLNSREVKARYGSLWEGYRTKTKWIVAYRVWFMLRRLMICVIVLAMKQLALQIILFVAQEVTTMIILEYGRPFKKSSKQTHEVANEVFITLTIYFMMFFSPYIPNIDVQTGIGFAFCGLLSVHLLISVIIMAWSAGSK
jgi:hypothetical protein